MTSPWSAAPLGPATRSVAKVAAAAAECTACPLYRDTTQTVFGAGVRRAGLVLVGEQPGDVEDKRGKPFVGPAGAVLWQCIEAAGVDRDNLWATNAVKHFKHETRGKRRLHKKPNTDEIEACHPWLEAELRLIRPRVVVALGAVAARSLTGRSLGIAASRGQVMRVTDPALDGTALLITYHPSAVLRADERAAEVRAALIEDLVRAKELLGGDR